MSSWSFPCAAACRLRVAAARRLCHRQRRDLLFWRCRVDSCSFSAANPLSSLSPTRPCSPSWPKSLTLAAAVVLLRCSGHGPAPLSAAGRVTLHLGARRRPRPCSVERRQVRTLQISTCRRPRCAIECWFISSGHRLRRRRPSFAIAA